MLSLPKAVESLPVELLSKAWADLSDEKAPFMRKQGSIRALAALAHAALVSKPGAAISDVASLMIIQDTNSESLAVLPCQEARWVQLLTTVLGAPLAWCTFATRRRPHVPGGPAHHAREPAQHH